MDGLPRLSWEQPYPRLARTYLPLRRVPLGARYVGDGVSRSPKPRLQRTLSGGRLLAVAPLALFVLAVGPGRHASTDRDYFEVEREYVSCLQKAEDGSKGLNMLLVVHPSRSGVCLAGRSDASRADWTLRSMMSFGIALENYNGDCGHYPLWTDIDSLSWLLGPYFSGRLTTTDGWGRKLSYRVTPGWDWYQLISAGSDGRFETIGFPDFGSLKVSDGSFDPIDPIVADDFESDIVCEAGGIGCEFSRLPRLFLPEPELAPDAPSIRSRPAFPPGRNFYIIYYDGAYLFAARHYGSSTDPGGNTEPGFFVHSKADDRWIQIVSVRSRDGKFGSSAEVHDLAVSWNFSALAKKAYVDLPLMTSGSIDFPDRIEDEPSHDRYRLRFNSRLGVPSAETVLFVGKADLAAAFAPSARR